MNIVRTTGRGWLCLAISLASSLAPAQALLDYTPEERTMIAGHGPWPLTPAVDRSNGVEAQPAAVAFGRLLFFEPALSADGTVACASCHRPERAFQDGLPVARGAAAGLRNTPSLLDVAQRRWLGWDGAHDSLWAASVTPLLAPREMAAGTAQLAATVRREARLAAAYRAVFARTPGSDDKRLLVDLGKALAAYQATLVSGRTPFDDFRDALLRGDRVAVARYPQAAQRGLRLFIGAGRCNVCHAGPAFTNGEFADVGLPHFVPGGVDGGRHDGLVRLRASPLNRLGPHNDAGAADPRAVTTRHVQPLHRNFGEFRVPGLRQLTHTAPFMHDGSLARIEDVVRHYSELDEERLHSDGERILRPLKLSPAQADDLAAFLRSLSSPPSR